MRQQQIWRPIWSALMLSICIIIYVHLSSIYHILNIGTNRGWWSCFRLLVEMQTLVWRTCLVNKTKQSWAVTSEYILGWVLRGNSISRIKCGWLKNLSCYMHTLETEEPVVLVVLWSRHCFGTEDETGELKGTHKLSFSTLEKCEDGSRQVLQCSRDHTLTT